MTRIGHQNLTAANLTGRIQYPDRNLEYLVFYNNNPAPLYVRLGSPELPNQRNYDISVPPNYIMAISVNSNQFGFRLGDDTVATALLTGNTVVEGMIDEAPPALGGVPIQAASLATSDLLNGITAFSGVTTLGPFNLTLWGGALVYVNLGAGSGQAVLQINASNSPSGPWLSVGTYALWPNVPSIINVPRTVAYMQVIINATAIAGEPAIAGNVSIRAILSEVQNLAYNPGTQAITKTYALPGLSSQQFTFVTVGLPAVSIAAIATVGSTASAAITFLVEASSDLVNWRQVTARDQNMSQGITIYRALGNLDLFIRVTISQIVGGQTANGSVYLSIPPQADLGYILNTIQQSLGDRNAPTNTNQDIYHQLDSMRTLENTMSSDLAIIRGDMTQQGSTVLGLGPIAAGAANTFTLMGNIPLNSYVTGIQCSHLVKDGTYTPRMQIALGIAGAPAITILHTYAPTGYPYTAAPLVGAWFVCQSPFYVFDSHKSKGLLANPYNYIWMLTNTAGGDHAISVVYTQ